MAAFEVWLGAHNALATLFVAFLSAFVTLAAVLVAWRTASSTKQTVAEMREARLQAVRPVLHMSIRNEVKAAVIWRRVDAFMVPVHFFDETKSEQSPFLLRNTVDVPSFDVTCRWRIGEAVNLPKGAKIVSLQHIAENNKYYVEYFEDKIQITDGTEFDILGDRCDFILSCNTSHLEILGKESMMVPLPYDLSRRVALFALYHAERQQIYKEPMGWPSIPISVNVECTGPSGERIERSFGFELKLGAPCFVNSSGSAYANGSMPSDWSEIRVSTILSRATKNPSVIIDEDATVLDIVATILQLIVTATLRMLR